MARMHRAAFAALACAAMLATLAALGTAPLMAIASNGGPGAP